LAAACRDPGPSAIHDVPRDALGCPGLREIALEHGLYHFHKGLGVNESVAWGDHFFVGALMKAMHGRSEAGWCLE